MAWESLRKDVTVPDPKACYKEGSRVEQYRLSKDALFLPKEKYIPVAAMEKLQIRKTLMHSGHCCGMGFPVYNLVVFYGGEKPEKVMFEKEKNAVRAADFLAGASEGLVWDGYVQPYIL